jgi:cytoskeletal protein RodZ
MEERIQKELNKKKSFWSFSWYTMNVYVVALVGAGVLALVFSNRGENNVVAQVSTPVTAEVKATPSAVVDLNKNDQVILNVENEKVSTPVKTTRQSRIVQEETSVSALVVENCQTASIVEPAIIEVAETVEVQRMPEEIQVPYPKKEVTKAKGRSLKLTRFTGK